MERRGHNPAKQFLQQYRALRARYASLCREIIALRESLTGTTVQLKDDVVTGGGTHDRMAAVVAKIIDMENGLTGEAAEVSTALENVLAAINSVQDETQRAVLTMRYVEGLGWPKISEQIHYEQRHTYTIHGRALAAVNEWLVKLKTAEGGRYNGMC